MVLNSTKDCKAVRHVYASTARISLRVMRVKVRAKFQAGLDIYEGGARSGMALQVLFVGEACQVAGMRNYLALKRVPTE